MITYNISLNDELAELVEASIKKGLFANRSEFFRSLLREHYCDEIMIERLSANDEDYKKVQRMKKDKSLEFVSFKEVIDEAA